MTTIFVRFKQEGWHEWPKATEQRIYLSSHHRHIFHLEVAIEVLSHDREIELHDFLDKCREVLWLSYPRAAYSQFGLDFGASSCEDIAKVLAGVRAYYPVKYSYDTHSGKRMRWIAVEVSEDGELGARIELKSEQIDQLGHGV